MTEEREYFVKGSDRLGRFTEAASAATLKLNRAYETRSALECIVLSSALLDALLRIGLLLQDQLTRNTDETDDSLLHQRDGDQIKSERAIIKAAVQATVIPADLGKSLTALYDKRNKCIHRYIISDINYDYATQLVFEYADVMEKVRRSVKQLEDQQFERGVGIVKLEADLDEPDRQAKFADWIGDMAKAKEERPNYDS